MIYRYHRTYCWLITRRCTRLGLLNLEFTLCCLQVYQNMAQLQPSAGNCPTTSRQHGLRGLTARSPEPSSQTYEDTQGKNTGCRAVAAFHVVLLLSLPSVTLESTLLSGWTWALDVPGVSHLNGLSTCSSRSSRLKTTRTNTSLLCRMRTVLWHIHGFSTDT